jgi:hypothetical protein
MAPRVSFQLDQSITDSRPSTMTESATSTFTTWVAAPVSWVTS